MPSQKTLFTFILVVSALAGHASAAPSSLALASATAGDSTTAPSENNHGAAEHRRRSAVNQLACDGTPAPTQPTKRSAVNQLACDGTPAPTQPTKRSAVNQLACDDIPELTITLTKDTPLRLTKDVTVSNPGRSIKNYYKGTRLLFSGFAEDRLQGFVINNGQVGEEVKVTRTMVYCADHRHPCQAYLCYQYPVVVAYASMTTWEGTEDLLVSANMPIDPTRLVPSPNCVFKSPSPPKKNQYSTKTTYSDGFAGRRPPAPADSESKNTPQPTATRAHQLAP
ncbi:hypothetical protein PtB15_13B324 [Puccinia triticina]|nr:hypothetical protein PtB15_13B324 [Puccinia triticina]